jgi:hypothetical protein
MEKLMQYVWQHRLWNPAGMTTVDGRAVRVIDPGLLNTGSGPDFFNAKLTIDGQQWVGNVEIHYRASDWHRHGHDKDPAYDSVILHVVDRDDAPVSRSDGQIIPQMRMPCSGDFAAACERMLAQSGISLPCASMIATMPRLYLTDWITTLGMERLYGKSERLAALAERYRGDWEEVAYVTLARAMGFGTNNDAFERLAQATPLKLLRRHADSRLPVEALLMGQAGLLPDAAGADAYVGQLIREYRFLAHKYGLRPLSPGCWKLGHIRPWNFPYRRIATLAEIVTREPRLMSALSAITGEGGAASFFSFDLSGYWADHFRPGAPSPGAGKAISQGSARLLMINVVVPLAHAWAMARGDDQATAVAVERLQAMKPERNSIVEMFERAGVECRDAFTSQALIELRRCYCETRKCLYCRLGHRMLSASAHKP